VDCGEATATSLWTSMIRSTLSQTPLAVRTTKKSNAHVISLAVDL
jgi:hypothetical protein